MQVLDAFLHTTFDDADESSSAHNDNGKVDYHSHESPKLPAPMPNPLSTYGVSEDKNTKYCLPHTAPLRRNEPPIVRVYPFERWPPAGAQNENPFGTSSLSRPFGEGPSRPRAVGPPFPTPLLTSLPAGLGLHNKQHNLHRTLLDSEVNTRDDPGPSGSRLTASVSSCGAQ